MKNYSSENTSLLIVDPFNDFLSEGGKLWPFTKETVRSVNLIKNLKNILSAVEILGYQGCIRSASSNRKRGLCRLEFRAPTHQGALKYSLFEKGSWGGEFHHELLPEAGDLIAQNHWTASGFANTNLDFLLKEHDIDHVVIAGMRANTCIDTTARYDLELGYHTTLIKDGIAGSAGKK